MASSQASSRLAFWLLVAGIGVTSVNCGGGLATVQKYEEERNVAKLFEIYGEQGTNQATRDAAEFALRRIGVPAVTELARILKHGDHATQGKAVQVLGHIGDPRASTVVLGTLLCFDDRGQQGYCFHCRDDSLSCSFRLLAVTSALIDIGDPQTIEHLRDLAQPQAQSVVRVLERSRACRASPACRSEGRCGGYEYPSPLEELHADASERAKREASCQPRSDTDCRLSEACTKHGLCFVNEPGRNGNRCVRDPDPSQYLLTAK